MLKDSDKADKLKQSLPPRTQRAHFFLGTDKSNILSALTITEVSEKNKKSKRP